MSGAARNATIWLLTSAALAAPASEAIAAPPAPLVYRRVYVPEENLSQQIRGLLPVKRAEFERLLALAAKHADAGAVQAATRIEQATFRARIEGQHLVDGEAELEIVATTKEPALLLMDSFNLALQSAAWRSADRRAAVVGTDVNGTLRCLVEQSGTLHLNWSHNATQSAEGTSIFDLQLPAALRRRLEIVADANMELSVDSGIIIGQEIDSTNAQQRIWTVDLTGHPNVKMFARQIVSQGPPTPLVVVREATKYNVLQSVLDVETSLTLDVLRQPLKELNLIAEVGLQITAVRLDNQSLPFRVLSPMPGGPVVVHVELPDELAGSGRAVEIEATASWPAGSRWTLPRIKLSGGELQEGRVEVHAPAWLRLQARPTGGCIQTEAAPATAGRPNDRLVFQFFEPDAAVEISLNQSATPLREESGTQITVEPNQATGVLIAELTTSGGARFSVEALVPQQWIIDAVETQPAELLADRSLSSHGQDLQVLRLNLSRPITAQQPLRLVVRGHCRRPANDQLLGDEFFRLARFPEVGDCRRLVAVSVNDPTAELRLTDDGNVKRIDSSHLLQADLRLFEIVPGPLLIESESANGVPTGHLQAMTASYRANVLVRADIARGMSHQTVSLRCQPEAASIGAIFVRLSPRPRGAVTWRMADDELHDLPAVLESQSSPTTTADEAVYRLMLPRPRSSAFEVLGRWSSPQSSASEISLVSLPAATRQTNLVEIHSSDRGINIRTSDAQSIPSPPPADDRFTTLCGRYRYEAGRRSAITVEPMPSGAIQTGAWIELLHITSYFSPGGFAQHEAAFTVRNDGVKSFRMRLPPSAFEYRLVMDGAPEEALDTTGSENAILVPLPEAKHTATVRVRYSSKGATLGMWPWGAALAPIPQVDLPILAQRWRVRLPPGVAMMSPPKLIDVSGQPAASAMSSVEAELPVSSQDRGLSLVDALSGPALASRFPFWRGSTGGLKSAEFAGWSDATTELPHSIEATISIFRPATILAWSLCLGLAAVASSLWLPVRGRWIPSAAGILAAVAIAFESPLAWLVGATSLGLIAGLMLLLFRPRLTSMGLVNARQPGTIALPLPAESAAIVIVFAVLGLASWVVAAPAESQAEAERGPPRAVFPIDSNQQPTGDYVFVDERLYDALHRASGSESASWPAWLIENAHYDLPATVSIHAGGAAVEELRAAFDIHTFHATTVQLPLRRDQVFLLEGRARLDGQPVSLAWDAEGRGVSLLVDVPGRHRVELAFGATAKPTADAIVLDIAVPPAAKSTASLPADSVGAKVVSGGANGQLTLQWPTHTSATVGVGIDADQLQLWKVRPGSLVLEGRFRLRPLGGAVREAVIEVDRRLRLLPGLTSGPISGVNIEDGASNRLKVELAEPFSSEVEFRLSWLWPDASGMGTLLLPRVALQTGQVLRDWAVVSVEPGLAVAELSGHGAPTPMEFAQVWPDAPTTGSVILGSSAEEQYRTVVVRPATSQPHVEVTTDWSVAGALAQAVYTARVKQVPVGRFEHRVQIPPQLKVRRVAIGNGSRLATIRWVQQPDGVLVVSLLEPPAAEQTLTVTAELAAPMEQTQLELPAMRLENAIEEDNLLRVYRQGDVLLRVESDAEWSRTDGAELGRYRRGMGRLVTELRSGPGRSEAPTISRVPNQSQVKGTMFTRAEEADGDWRGEVNLNLTVSSGVVDELRLSIPEEWAGPFEIEPMEYGVEVSASEPRRQLVLRPRGAVSGSLEIKLRGPIHGGAGGVQAPDVTLAGNPSIDRFVFLDRGTAGQSIDWETTGLLAAGTRGATELPAAWRDTAGNLFRVVGPRFDATARIRQAGSAAPRVHLADLRAVMKPERRIAVTAAMIVQPLGPHEAIFSLPSGCRLVQALVDDVTVPCARIGLRNWKVAAPSDSLPYGLTIIYDTYLPADASRVAKLQLSAPLLVGMEVDQILWTVESDESQLDFVLTPKDAVKRTPVDVARACDASSAELARLHASGRALEAVVSAQGTSIPPSVIAENFVRWRRALAISRSRLLKILEEADEPSEMEDEIQASLDAASKVRQRLVQAGVLDEDELVDFDDVTVQDVESPSAFHILGTAKASELQLAWQVPAASVVASRTAVAWSLALASLVLGFAASNVLVREWLMSHGAFVMGIVGVAWWLLAPFGWLGWFPVLAAIWCSVRSPWPKSRFQDGSTIQRWAGGPTG